MMTKIKVVKVKQSTGINKIDTKANERCHD